MTEETVFVATVISDSFTLIHALKGQQVAITKKCVSSTIFAVARIAQSLYDRLCAGWPRFNSCQRQYIILSSLASILALGTPGLLSNMYWGYFPQI
jgi:hypothetical protein